MQKIQKLMVVGGGQSLSLPETFIRAFNDLYSRQAQKTGPASRDDDPV